MYIAQFLLWFLFETTNKYQINLKHIFSSEKMK